jgi:hypothetical protein
VTKLRLLLTLERNSRFAPAEPWSAEKMEPLQIGATYQADLSVPRSRSEHNTYWAGLAYACKHIFEGELARLYPTSKHLHKALLVELGYYTELPFIMLRDEEITERMKAEGIRELMRLLPVPKEMRGKLGDIIETVYQSMRREGPHYGKHIVEDSTRWDAMRGDEFHLYFERAKIVVWEWIERDPWDEWLQMVKARDPK